MGLGETGTYKILDEFTPKVDVEAMAKEIIQLRTNNYVDRSSGKVLEISAGNSRKLMAQKKEIKRLVNELKRVQGRNEELNHHNQILASQPPQNDSFLHRQNVEHRRTIAKDKGVYLKEITRLKTVAVRQQTVITQLDRSNKVLWDALGAKQLPCLTDLKEVPEALLKRLRPSGMISKSTGRQPMSAQGRLNISKGRKLANKARKLKQAMNDIVQETQQRHKGTKITREQHSNIVDLSIAGFKNIHIANHLKISTFSVAEYSNKPCEIEVPQMSFEEHSPADAFG